MSTNQIIAGKLTRPLLGPFFAQHDNASMGTAIVLGCLCSACDQPPPAKPQLPADRMMEATFNIEGGTTNYPYADLVVPSPTLDSLTSSLSQRPQMDQKMRVLTPRSHETHNILTVQADPSIDYKIRTIGPGWRKPPAEWSRQQEFEPPNAQFAPEE